MSRGWVLLSMTAAAGAAGCAHPPWAHPASPVWVTANAQPDDVSGVLDPPKVALASPDDAIVRVVGPQSTCSGALVADDLVLTAHHCVVKRGARGEPLLELVATSSIDVQLGGDYLPWGNVGLKAILAPPCGERGGRGDVAVLVLERRLVGLAPIALRDVAPRAGEHVYTAGFGRCALSPEGIRRREREGGPIASVSGGAFESLASVCPGDSGGPVLDPVTHEIVGVVSLSAMDHDEATRARSVFARVDGMLAKVLVYARLVADGADPGDLPPLSCE